MRVGRSGGAISIPSWFPGLLLSVVVSLAIVGSVPAVAQAQEEVRITSISVDDETVIDERDGVRYLWQSDSQTITVSVETGPGNGTGQYEVCLTSTSVENGTTSELRCQAIELSGAQTEQITFGFDAWPEDLGGSQTVTAVVYDGTISRNAVANESVSIHVMRADADIDSDGVTNEGEVAAGTDFTDADTDDDGLSDGLELNTYETDPLDADTDGDGLTDGAEVNEHGTDPTTTDTDGDGLRDGAEITDHGTDPNRADTDGDGLSDSDEVDSYETDPTDPDSDDDGLDDGAEVEVHETDPTLADTDEDGLSDALEVHTYGTNPRKADTDADGLDDGEEVYETNTDPAVADTDGDGLKDGPELNTHGTNPNRADTDGDGLNDGAELREHDTDPTLADTDGDGEADAAEVRAGAPAVSRWGLAALVVFGAALIGGVAWVRRRGYPRRVRALGLGPPVESSSGGAAKGDSGVTEIPPPSRDQVLGLLNANGGRMKQSAIVESTDWSKAKVSRVLKQMEADDQITKISIGRENVVTLPGAEPEGSRGPFDGDGLKELSK